MTDEEYEVMDELYFVHDFDELQDLVAKDDAALVPILESLFEKGWLKVQSDIDSEVPKDDVDIRLYFNKYYYLASKQGLLAHNTR